MITLMIKCHVGADKADRAANPSRSNISKVELGTKWEKLPTNDHHYDDIQPSDDDHCHFHEDNFDNLCCTTKGNSNCDNSPLIFQSFYGNI